MYIAIYVSSIVFFFAGAIGIFVFCDFKNKKIAKKLRQKNDEKNQTSLQENLNETSEETLANIEQKSKDLQNGLEDFQLEFEKKEPRKSKRNFNLNPFSSGNDLKENNEEKDDELDKKINEYEDFLKRNLDLDDNDLDEDEMLSEPYIFDDFPTENTENLENYPPKVSQKNYDFDDDLKSFQKFDYNSLKGKSEDEIEEIIKNLPPKVQEILMSDILARRKYDDEEQ